MARLRSTRVVRVAWPYLVAGALPLGATAAAWTVERVSPVPNISLIYVPVVLVVAIRFGTRPSLVTAAMSVLAYDFFLVRPRYTFTIARPQDVLGVIVFCTVAAACSRLAIEARGRTESARRQARQSQTLYELGQTLISAGESEDVLSRLVAQVRELFHARWCAVFAREGDFGLELSAVAGTRDVEPRTAAGALSQVLRSAEGVRLPQPTRQDEGRRAAAVEYVPLTLGDRVIGVMELGVVPFGASDTDDQTLLASVGAQAALVIQRGEGEEERRRVKLLEESNLVKSTLLSAVSHDLRTPLASIKASATSLLYPGARWREAERREMLEAIDVECNRLDHLVGNLLDLSRIEAGVLRPFLDWYSVTEIVESAAVQAASQLQPSRLQVQIDASLTLVRVDLVLLVQALTNLLENAGKYSPEHSLIEVAVQPVGDGISISVADHGPGIPFDRRDHIFDRFTRSRRTGDGGVGLGLAICRGIVQAHGGTIKFTPTMGGGTTMVIELPKTLGKHASAFTAAVG